MTFFLLHGQRCKPGAKRCLNKNIFRSIRSFAVYNHIGEMIAVKSAPITFGMDGKRRWLHIPDYLNLEIESIKGGDPNKDSLAVNPPFTIAKGYDLIIARSIKYSYKDHGFEWDSSGKNGSYSKFNYGP